MSLIVSLSILNDKYYPILVFFWISSILFFLIKTTKVKRIKFSILHLSWKTIFFALIIALPILVRVSSLNENRVHQDSFITGYYSAHYNLTTTNFFSVIPQDPSDWVSQFPTPFFFLQKSFFLIFGTNPLNIKLSIMPYILVTSIALFLTTKKLFNSRVAVITLILYSFFSPGLYMDTLGLHTASSDAIFSLFIYFLIFNYFEQKRILSASTGVICAFCFLTYQSAYIAIPVAVVFFIFEFLTKNKRKILLKYLIISFAFLLTLGPFLAYSSNHDNYMFKRFHQVSFVNDLKTHISPIKMLENNALLSIKSMYKEGIGGIGGYNFGHLAFFEKLSLLFFSVGFLLNFFLLRKKPYLFILPVVISSAFLGGIVITLMPPNFHRLAVAFPYIAIVSAIPFYFLLKIKINRYVLYLSIIILLLIYSCNNLNYFLEMVKVDTINNPPDFQYVQLIKYIQRNYPKRKMYVAAYPSFVFNKIYYFFNKSRDVETDYPDNLLARFNRNEKYVYIILYPEDFNDAFQNADLNGKINNNLTTFLSAFAN